MAVSTTQSIWRSGGGDQTRTAYCGTGLMVAQFYIANLGPAATTNVTVSNAANAPALILPAGAVITSITITQAGTSGTFDLGWAALDGSPSSFNGLLIATSANVSKQYLYDTSGAGGEFGIVMSATEMVNITVTDNTSAVGSMTGYIQYFVTDPLVGQQNV